MLKFMLPPETKKDSQNIDPNLQSRLMQANAFGSSTGQQSSSRRSLSLKTFLFTACVVVLAVLAVLGFYSQKQTPVTNKNLPQPAVKPSPANQLFFSQNAVKQAVKTEPLAPLKTSSLLNGQTFPPGLKFLIPVGAQQASQLKAEYPGGKTGFEISFVLPGVLYQEFLKYSNALRGSPGWVPNATAYASSYGFLAGTTPQYSVQASFTQKDREILVLIQALALK